MLKRLRQPGHGHLLAEHRDLALNLSFVLHERSDSRAVQSAVRACRAHASEIRNAGPDLARPATASEHDHAGVTLWLTATIGLPPLMAQALGALPEQVIAVDSNMDPLRPFQFFRATASLFLPDARQQRVGVAALVLRPDRRTSHIAISGVHEWPAERDAAIRSLERLIQGHAGQWMPSRALWSAPAEALLIDEVY
ncbi:MAG: hypothetical protein WD628_04300 [Thermomicrobiales bacterium]